MGIGAGEMAVGAIATPATAGASLAISAKGAALATHGSFVVQNAVRNMNKNPVEITIDRKDYPESAKHLDEAIQSGKSNEGVIDRSGASKRRRENLKGVDNQNGMDREEAPPAVINTGENSSVKHVPKSDNRGYGKSIGKQIRGLPDGTPVKIVLKN